METNHEDVICVWNLATSSEEFTEVIKLQHKDKHFRYLFIHLVTGQVNVKKMNTTTTVRVNMLHRNIRRYGDTVLPAHVCPHTLLQE